MLNISIYACVCVCVCVHACMCAQLLQLCLILCDPMDCSPPGSSVPGIPKVGILECVATPSSRAWDPLQGIFLTQGLNLHLLFLLHYRQILHHRATEEALYTCVYIHIYMSLCTYVTCYM